MLDEDDKYLTSNPITPFGKYLDVKTNGFDTPAKIVKFHLKAIRKTTRQGRNILKDMVKDVQGH